MAETYPDDNEILNISERTDHDLLIEVITYQKIFMKQFSNHLHHHFLITAAALSAGLMGTASFIVGLLLLLVKGI